MKHVSQQKWQDKVGLISKSYKIRKEVAEEFALACERNNETQAQVIMRLMNGYIITTKKEEQKE